MVLSGMCTLYIMFIFSIYSQRMENSFYCNNYIKYIISKNINRYKFKIWKYRFYDELFLYLQTFFESKTYKNSKQKNIYIKTNVKNYKWKKKENFLTWKINEKMFFFLEKPKFEFNSLMCIELDQIQIFITIKHR